MCPYPRRHARSRRPYTPRSREGLPPASRPFVRRVDAADDVDEDRRGSRRGHAVSRADSIPTGSGFLDCHLLPCSHGLAAQPCFLLAPAASSRRLPPKSGGRTVRRLRAAVGRPRPQTSTDQRSRCCWIGPETPPRSRPATALNVAPRASQVPQPWEVRQGSLFEHHVGLPASRPHPSCHPGDRKCHSASRS